MKLYRLTAAAFVSTLFFTTMTVFPPAQATRQQPDFALSATPDTQSVASGTTATFAVSIEGVYGFRQAVSLSAKMEPATSSIITEFSPNTITPSTTSRLTVKIPANASAKSYTVTVTGRYGTLEHSQTTTLTVTPSAADFTLTVNPTTLTLAPSASGSFNVNVNKVGNFTQAVNVSSSVTPDEGAITTSVSSNSVTPGGSATVTVTASDNAPSKIYTITITATAGQSTHIALGTVVIGNPSNDLLAPVVSEVTLSKKKVKRKADATVAISWKSSDNVGVASHDLVFAPDGLDFSTQVVSGLPGNAQNYIWTIPADVPKTKQGVIKVYAIDAAVNIGEGVSTAFSIK